MYCSPVVAVIVLVAGLAPAATAYAHVELETATPSVGGSVALAPSEVTIGYSASIEPRSSTIKVQDASGARVDMGDVHAAPGSDRRLAVGLKPLPTGIYKVFWQVTGSDTHKMEGTYSFTVNRSAMDTGLD